MTTNDGTKDNGCIINTAVQVGAEPTRLAISVQKGNYSREIIEKTKKFNVSVLEDSVSFDFIRHFGMQSGRDCEKLDGFKDFSRSHNGLIYLTKNANAFFSVDVENQVDLGSHILFTGKVIESKKLSSNNSCTYAYYHKSIKPKI